MKRLPTLHYSGPIIFYDPSLPFDLSFKPTLADLSLKQTLPSLLYIGNLPLTANIAHSQEHLYSQSIFQVSAVIYRCCSHCH